MIFLDLSDFFHFFRYAAAARRRFGNTTVASQNTPFPLLPFSSLFSFSLRQPQVEKVEQKSEKKH